MEIGERKKRHGERKQQADKVVYTSKKYTQNGVDKIDGCENLVTVYCNENSAIYHYCVRNGIKHARIEEKDTI